MKTLIREIRVDPWLECLPLVAATSRTDVAGVMGWRYIDHWVRLRARPDRMTDLVTPDEFRAALGRFASGVTIITVETPTGEVHGMTANAFCSVSLRPPLVLVCIDHLAETYLHIRERRQFGVSVLKEEQEALSEFFADPERNHDAAYRLGVKYRPMQSGTPVLQNTLANLDCSVVNAYDGGDHTIFVGEVREVIVAEGAPLLYFRGRYRSCDVVPEP